MSMFYCVTYSVVSTVLTAVFLRETNVELAYLIILNIAILFSKLEMKYLLSLILISNLAIIFYNVQEIQTLIIAYLFLKLSKETTKITATSL